MPRHFTDLFNFARPWSLQLGEDLNRVLRGLKTALNDMQIAPAAPETIQAGVAANAGVANTPATMDHRHAIETAAPIGLSNANSEGAGTALLRATAGIKRDVRVALGGVDIATRNRLNFIASDGVAVVGTDDLPNDSVNISLALASGPPTPSTPSEMELIAYALYRATTAQYPLSRWVVMNFNR